MCVTFGATTPRGASISIVCVCVYVCTHDADIDDYLALGTADTNARRTRKTVHSPHPGVNFPAGTPTTAIASSLATNQVKVLLWTQTASGKLEAHAPTDLTQYKVASYQLARSTTI